MEDKNENGEIVRMKFRSKVEKEKDISGKDNDLNEFEVMINPATIDRKLSIEKTSNKSGKSKDKSDVFSASPEVFSFSFYLDGTNVVPNQKGRSVSDMISNFLKIVYQKDGKLVQALIIEYLGDSFIVCTNSIDINYSLFDLKGNPLRAKVSCSFSTVKESAPQKPSNKSKTKQQKPDPVPEICNTENARNEEKDSLKEQNMTPTNANFSHESGIEMYVEN